MDAVEKDSLEYLKEGCSRVWNEQKMKFEDKSFKDVHDSDLILSEFPDELKDRAYTESGEVRHNAWRSIGWWVEEKRVFTSWNLYQAIKNDVEVDKGGNMTVKEGHTISACML